MSEIENQENQYLVKDEDIIKIQGYVTEPLEIEFKFQTLEDDSIDTSIQPKLITEDDERVLSLTIDGEGTYTVSDHHLLFNPNESFSGTGNGAIIHAVSKKGDNISVRFIPELVEPIEEGIDFEKLPNETILTVEYENLLGEKISPSQHIRLNHGDYYAVLPMDIADYEALDDYEVMTGIINRFDLTQTYFYQPLRQGLLTLKYVDQNGHPIVPDELIESDFGDQYRTKAKVFDEYDLVEVVGDEEGTFSENESTVTYQYKKATHATLIIKFLDTHGHPLLDELNYRLKIGDQYKTHPRRITGYKVTEKPHNADGTIKPGVTTIIFTYHPRTNAKVVVRYVDEEDNLVIPSTSLSGAVGEPYKVEQRLIPTYDFVRFEGPVEGEFSDENRVVKCIYRQMTYK